MTKTYYIWAAALVALVGCDQQDMTIFESTMPKNVDAGNVIGRNRLFRFDSPFDAIRAGSLDGLKAHIENGVSPESRDTFGKTLLHKAVEESQIEIIEYLLDDLKMDINVTETVDRTPLHLAAIQGNLPVVQLLVEKGADLEAKSEFGETPLVLANRRGMTDVAVYLSDHGAIGERPITQKKTTPPTLQVPEVESKPAAQQPIITDDPEALKVYARMTQSLHTLDELKKKLERSGEDLGVFISRYKRARFGNQTGGASRSELAAEYAEDLKTHSETLVLLGNVLNDMDAIQRDFRENIAPRISPNTRFVAATYSDLQRQAVLARKFYNRQDAVLKRAQATMNRERNS